MRVLLLVTTHLSLEHVAFLRKCWPPATHKSSLLREADVADLAQALARRHFKDSVASKYCHALARAT